MVNMKLACVVVMCMAMLYAQTGGALTCGQISNNLVPCVGYLQYGGLISKRCCDGVKSIANDATTTPARRFTCNCLKSAAAAVKKINPNNAQLLPGKCGVNIPYKISTSTNCASIK
ncbi:non-specific lipid-transfer protein 1-like [Cicer arietinum]|uniref:Non-specific lipid-transfer protein n=1 Tax=Cicer arietinum TaxID=3827 RepID=A0A1S2Z3T1_CICAR|nr:non-specific lipid-transfer protein 1-like [Cicer arietinum]